ncbi:pilus assembly protein PilM [Geobacter hydrogenophilus]|uniref:Pilus assembly protein PilM n=2 Tax=Geobacter hydrogenophilus TaxID=40983 RepID=A0A9W6G194_9BACT|nr:pilus assembly protein PilM [Geobacter hydrogenophilus]MBT0893166.1 pilus assembly protein PilM [Geobacter hydrogenophilus]GLI38990.1 pilus assembly protein PilM [Geobacter hydrogenophilus]
MFFSRNAVGMEITHHGVRMAAIGGKKNRPKLLACETAQFPAGTIRLVHREPNVAEPALFVREVKEAYLKLLHRTGLVSVSLPDACGRVAILDLETRFKSRDEGSDIIRWKLKKSLPFDVNEMHLDYQILREKENGEISVLVAIIARQVISQYEELLAEAGIQPAHIDFTSFNLYRLFSPRIAMSESSLFAACHDNVLSILIFHHDVLEFYRAKELPGSDLDMNRIFMETNNSLLFYRDKNPGREFREAFCLAPPGDGELFRTVITEACGLEPFMLSPDTFIDNPASSVVGGGVPLASLAAAVGAATRNL